MRLLYTSDLHGSEDHYATLLAEINATHPDLVVLGGDLLPDDSAIKPETFGHGQPEFVGNQFRKSMEEIRSHSGCIDILLIFGNHDWRSAVPPMESLAQDNLVTILDHHHSIKVGGLNFVGYSCTPPTPWFVKDFERLDKPEDRHPLLGGARWDARFSKPIQHSARALYGETQSIAEELQSLCKPPDPWVFVVHAPPIETKLDRAYGNTAVGSRAIREVIERHKPMLSLHGHIHESPAVSGHWRDTLGKTIAVNPGQSTRSLHYVMIDIDVAEGKITQMNQARTPICDNVRKG